MRADLVISGDRVFLDGALRPAALIVQGGRIADVVQPHQAPTDCPVHTTAHLILPGFVDTHVHINEPGRTEWEGFETATRAAAAGGITCLVDMPLNCIPVTTSLSALREKLAACRDRLFVDCGFFGGVIPGNLAELEPMVDEGVLGFKSFLIHSGIDDFPMVQEEHLRAAMPVLSRRNTPYLIHAELNRRADTEPPGDARSYLTFLASRPDHWETDAIDLMVELSQEYNARVHIVHLSSARALPALGEARRRGVSITVETCPHYLTLAAEEIPDGATEFKCAPPIRRASNRDELWRGLGAGVVDFVVSDHSPCTPALKLKEEGDFMKAWGGIASLQLGPANLWTHSQARGHSLSDFVRWLASEPARFVGLGSRKGRLGIGFDADVVFWDPEAQFAPVPEALYQRHKLHPYADRTLRGQAQKTFLRGELIFEREGHKAEFFGPRGRPLLGAA